MSREYIDIPEQAEAIPEEKIEELHDFYSTSRDKSGELVIKFDKLRIVGLLRKLGYLRYDTPEGQSMYVYCNDQKLRITSQTKIVDAFEDYVRELPDRKIERMLKKDDDEDGEGETYYEKITSRRLLEVLYNSDMSRYFNIVDRLRPERPIEFMKDERFAKYLYFNNTCVRITKNGVENIPYSSDLISGYVWESAIVNRDFTYTETPGDFEKFCRNICGKEDKDRFASLQTILGFLMHDNYETDLKAVLLTDVNKETAGKAAGRTGKGLLGKALSHVLNRQSQDCKYVAISGKGFDHAAGNGTCYSQADISTQLIHIEDVDKRFDFEDLYNDVTDGAKIRKNYDRFPIKKYIKFMVSANHTIDISSTSTRGRICLFELSNFYNDRHRPTDDFKRRFFESDWTDDDWNQFYSFMCRCCRKYFEKGLIEPTSVNYDERRLEEYFESNKDFMFWFRELISDVFKSKTPMRVVLRKVSVYEQWKTEHPNMQVEQKYFTIWCKKFLDIKGIPYKEKRSTEDLLIINPAQEDFV